MNKSVEQRLAEAQAQGYSPGEYLDLVVNALGGVAGIALAVAIVARDPRRWLTHHPVDVSEPAGYALVGGLALALFVSHWLCGRNRMLRLALVALWVGLAGLFATKWAGYLIGFGY